MTLNKNDGEKGRWPGGRTPGQHACSAPSTATGPTLGNHKLGLSFCPQRGKKTQAEPLVLYSFINECSPSNAETYNGRPLMSPDGHGTYGHTTLSLLAQPGQAQAGFQPEERVIPASLLPPLDTSSLCQLALLVLSSFYNMG